MRITAYIDIIFSSFPENDREQNLATELNNITHQQ